MLEGNTDIILILIIILIFRVLFCCLSPPENGSAEEESGRARFQLVVSCHFIESLYHLY